MRAAALFLVVLLAPFWVANAQSDEKADAKKVPAKEKPYALIFGTVFAPDGRGVYGVKVKIRRADQKKPHWELVSDHRGEFAQRVPAGKSDYIVWADLKDLKLPDGKHLKAGTEVTVHIDNEERSDIGLHLIW